MLNTKGFTIIELLCVIVIIATLGTSAFGSYLDFRNEARAAVIRKTLQSLRGSVRNQMMNARLRCGKTFTTTAERLAFDSALENNDITYNDPLYGRVCTTAQMPNAADRPFFNLGGVKRAQGFGTSLYNFPENPFYEILRDDGDLPAPHGGITLSFGILGQGPDSECPVPSSTAPCTLLTLADSVCNKAYPWAFNMLTGDVYATTNVMGECNY